MFLRSMYYFVGLSYFFAFPKTNILYSGVCRGVIEYEFSVPFHLLFTKNVESKAGVAAPHVPVPGVATISGGGETSRNVGTSCRKILYKVDGNGRILSNTQEGMDVEIRYTSDSSASIHSHRIIPSSASTDSTKVSAVGSSGIAQGLGLHPQSLYHDTYNGKSFAIRHTVRLSVLKFFSMFICPTCSSIIVICVLVCCIAGVQVKYYAVLGELVYGTI